MNLVTTHLLSFFLVLVIILFGALIYFCEAGLDNWSHELGGFARPDVTGDNYELSPFKSIPASFWWVLVTATTVGYGDMYPTSFEGKMIATLTMMVGVLALALPVSVIGANFADIYGKKQKQTLQAEQRMLVQMWKGQIGDENGAENTVFGEAGSMKTVRLDPSSDDEAKMESQEEELSNVLKEIKVLSERASRIAIALENRRKQARSSSNSTEKPPPPNIPPPPKD